MMSGGSQGVILLAASAIAIDAGGCPVINSFTQSNATGVPHEYSLSLSALFGYRRRTGIAT
jgi:hypothetical protein